MFRRVGCLLMALSVTSCLFAGKPEQKTRIRQLTPRERVAAESLLALQDFPPVSVLPVATAVPNVAPSKRGMLGAVPCKPKKNSDEEKGKINFLIVPATPPNDATLEKMLEEQAERINAERTENVSKANRAIEESWAQDAERRAEYERQQKAGYCAHEEKQLNTDLLASKRYRDKIRFYVQRWTKPFKKMSLQEARQLLCLDEKIVPKPPFFEEK